MKLVIIGAGGYGQTVADLAVQSEKYDDVVFLDDNEELLKSGKTIGKCSDYVNYKSEYIYPAFGNNKARLEWINKLMADGYNVPTIIHSSAYISPRAKVKVGTVVLPKAIINTDTFVEKGCIINLGAIIDHGCVIEDGCHICLGAIVKGENRIKSCIKIEAGEVVAMRQYPV